MDQKMIAVAAGVAFGMWAAWALLEKFFDRTPPSTSVNVTALLNGDVIKNAITFASLDEENAGRLGRKFLTDVMFEERLSRDPSPEFHNELTRLRRPKTGWRMRQSVLSGDNLEQATLTIIMQPAKAPAQGEWFARS